jgi:hypothetical protein
MDSPDAIHYDAAVSDQPARDAADDHKLQKRELPSTVCGGSSVDYVQDRRNPSACFEDSQR